MNAARRPRPGDLPAAEIKAALVARLPELVARFAPGAKRHGGGRAGGYWMACNPVVAEKNPSFQIKSHGGFVAYNDDAKGDVLDLISYVHGRGARDRAFAFDWARDFLGVARMSAEQRQVIARRAQQRAQQRAEAEAAEKARRARSAFDLWLKATPIAPGDPADRYLKGRGLDLAAIAGLVPGEARLLAKARHWIGRFEAPALVWPIRRQGAIIGVELTFLDVRADGSVGKFAIDAPRLTLGEKGGGVVAISNGPSGLSPRQAAIAGQRDPLILCEGTETGLSAALAVPEARVWSCLSLGNLAEAPVTAACVGRVYVALENDLKPVAVERREKMLDALAARIGGPPGLIEPPCGSDLNDTLQGKETKR